LGGDDFLQGLMEDFRSCFGAKRKKAGKKIQGGWEGLKTLRQTK
jgi:hypothetical protein